MKLSQDVDLRRYHTFKLPARARYFTRVQTQDELLAVLAYAKQQHLKVYVLGGGSNLIFTGNLDGLVILVQLKGISFQGDTVHAAAGENWHGLVEKTLEQGLFGLENLALIPGSVGAAPIQNIGAYGLELCERFTQLTAVHRSTLETRCFPLEDCEFEYRNSVFKHREAEHWVITELSLVLSPNDRPQLHHAGLQQHLECQKMPLNARSVASAVIQLRRQKLPAPEELGNVGSFFKNPVLPPGPAESLKAAFPQLPVYALDAGVKLSAAWLIDQAGLKCRAVGDIQVSAQHALVLVNRGRGRAEDLAQLLAVIGEAVRAKYGIDLEVEPVFYPAAPRVSATGA